MWFSFFVFLYQGILIKTFKFMVPTRKIYSIYTKEKETNLRITLKKVTKLQRKISKRRNRESTKQPENNEKNGNSKYLSIILNINVLNSSIKRHRIAKKYIYKTIRIHLYTTYKRLTSCKDTNWLRVKGYKKIFHANRNKNRTEAFMLISRYIVYV